LTFNDNFGLLLAKLVRAPSEASLKNVAGFFDSGGNARTLNIFGFSTDELFNYTQLGATIAKAQVGKGGSTALRQDRDIESPFTNGGLEDTKVSVQPMTYNAGKVEIPTLISPTTGAGTITEEILMAHLEAGGATDFDFLFSRKLVGASGFIVGESINIINEVFI